MKKSNKNLITGTLGFVSLVSLVLACGEAETLAAQILWSAGWIAVAAIAGYFFEKVDGIEA